MHRPLQFESEDTVCFERDILEALGHSVVVTDMKGIVTYMNPAAESLYGYSVGEAVGKRGADLMVASEDEEEGQTLRSRAASGKKSTARIRLQRKDGSTFLGRIQASPVRDETGEVTALVGLTWDVTEEVRAQEDLFAQKEATEALIDAIPDLIFHLGRDGTYRFVHADRPELLVQPVQELLGRRISEVMEPDVADLWMRTIERTVDENATGRVEYVVTTISGEERTFEGHLAPLEDDGVVVVARDITDHKRAQRSLEAERDQFIEVARQAPVIMAIYRGPDHVCEFANKNLIDVLGGREIIGLSARESIPELSAEGLIQLMDRVYETGEAITLNEKRVELNVDPDLPPVERFANFNYVPLRNGDGSVTGVLSHHVDITEQVVARRRLQVHNSIIRAVLKAESTETTARVALEGLAESVPSDLSAVVLFDEDSSDIIPLSVRGRNDSDVLKLRGLATRDDLPPGVDPDEPGTTHFRRLGEIEEGGAFIDALKAEGLTSLLVETLSDGRECTGILLLAAKHPFREEHEKLCQVLAEPLAVAIRSARMLEDLAQARERLETLNLKLINAHEQERHSLALELHDHVGQVLTSVMFALHDFDDESLSEATFKSLERSRLLIQELAGQIRSLSLDLRPPMLDDFGLKSTLEWYQNKVYRETEIDVVLSTMGIADKMLPEAIRTTAFRIIQEAITNVARHADTKEATVKVLRRDDRLLIRIRDEGRGFDVKEARAKHISGGLPGMIERVRLLDGDVTIESAPGKGTTIVAVLPIRS